MILTPEWTDVGRVVRALTLAGPTVSPTGAAATVARLRRAVRWSEPMVIATSEGVGTGDAAHRVVACPTLVVDRRGAVDVCAGLVEGFLGDEEAPRGPGSWGMAIGPRPGPLSMVGAATALHALAPRVKGMWDPFARRRILVAPNVLEAAERGALDQIDYARWVALRAGLWGVMFEHAPWLSGHLAHLSRQLPGTTAGFSRTVLLLDGLASAQMATLTLQDIPSVGWIRRNSPEPAGVVGLRALRHLGASVPEVEAKRARALAFATRVVEVGGLPTLLRTPDHLPTPDEFEQPEAWVSRVGL